VKLPRIDKIKTIREKYTSGTLIFKNAKRIIIHTFKTSPKYSTGLLITIILLALSPFFSAWITSKVIDELINTISQTNNLTHDLLILIILFLGVLVLTGLIDTISGFFEYNLEFEMENSLTKELTIKYAYLDIEHYETPKTSDLLQKVRENQFMPIRFIIEFFWLIRPVVGILSAIVIITSLSPLLTTVIVLASIPEAVSNVFFGKKVWELRNIDAEKRRDFRRSNDHLTSEMSLMELKIFKTREFLIDRAFSLFKTFRSNMLKVQNRRRLISILLSLVYIAGGGIAIVIITMAVIIRKITIGQFSFYISASRQLGDSFATLLRRTSNLYEISLYVNDFYELLDLPEKIIPGTAIIPKSKTPSNIFIDNINFHYPGSKEYIFNNFSLSIKPGEHLAIVGENGAGKTTLIKLLMRFYDVTKGKILIDNKEIKDIDPNSWYEKIGALFQEFNTYHFDAKTNIGMGDPDRLDNKEEIIEAAKKACAHEFIEKYEGKYEQILSKDFTGGIRPSWGQWQRIALARVFFKDAPILILDEPTSSIDPKAEYEIFTRLFEFAKGKTVIIISHRFSTVRNAERIIVLDKGKIIEEGNHEELLAIHEGKYKTAFELQRKGYE